MAKLGEVNDVTFFEKDSLKLKYKITEDMSEAIEEYKTVLAAIGYDNNKMVLTNNGNIYGSFIVNGVEQSLPLSEIKHTNFGPIYEENKSITKNGKIIYCTNGLNSDVNATFETPFDIENGYFGWWFYSKTLNQIMEGGVGAIKDAPSEELEASMIVTSDSVQLKKDFIDMIYSQFNAEEIELYGLEIGFSFINEIPNWDGTINIETINYVSNNAITCSYTYTYSGLNTEEVSFNDKNIIKDFSITFERPLVETDVFATPLSDEPMPALLVFSLMMDTEDNQHFTPTPMFSTYMMLINVPFFNIHDTEDNYVKYQISYREGGVPQVIYSNLEVGECNIEATILPELYVYNYRPTFIEETNVIYNGYMVTNILPIGRIANGSSGYSDKFNLGLFINEIVLPNGFVQMPEYLSNSPYLKKITIPNGVTSIIDGAFKQCSSLSEITIPDSVTSIGNNAFQDCYNLSEITCLATTAPSLGSYVFSGLPSSGVLKVPNGSDYSTWLSNLSSGWTIQYI